MELLISKYDHENAVNALRASSKLTIVSERQKKSFKLRPLGAMTPVFRSLYKFSTIQNIIVS
jgi:hypothetical protein